MWGNLFPYIYHPGFQTSVNKTRQGLLLLYGNVTKIIHLKTNFKGKKVLEDFIFYLK